MLRNKTELSIVGRSQQRYFPRQKVSNTEKKKLSLYHDIPRRQKSRRILKSFINKKQDFRWSTDFTVRLHTQVSS